MYNYADLCAHIDLLQRKGFRCAHPEGYKSAGENTKEGTHMNGISSYQYGAYNAPYASSYQKNVPKDNPNAKTDETKKSAETSASGITKGTKEALKNAGVTNILGNSKNGKISAVQSEKYGSVVGEPKLSEKAEEYYNSLKKKFGNMDFVLVSKDKIADAKANAASFGNPNRTVVLIDEEKLEKMATDESFRKKYEGIISMSQSKMAEMAKSFAGNPNITGFGMNVDKDGKTSFFATVSDTSKGQKERIEKQKEHRKEVDEKTKAKLKKNFEEKKAELKKAAKEAQAERLEQRRHPDRPDKTHHTDKPDRPDRPKPETISADSVEELIEKVQNRFYTETSGDVRTDAEKAVGGSINFTA